MTPRSRRRRPEVARTQPPLEPITPTILVHAPELATLALLDETLAMARLALLAHNPELCDDLIHEPTSARTTLLAKRLVARVLDLSALLTDHRRAVDRLLAPPQLREDDTLF